MSQPDSTSPIHTLNALVAKLLGTLPRIQQLAGGQYLKQTFPGRVLLPPPGCQPAIVVPLDYDVVVPFEKDRTPYSAIAELFLRQREEMAGFIKTIEPWFNITGITVDRQDDVSPYWHNPYFGPMDARVLYAIARSHSPKQIIEIGSGNSTKFLRRAISDGKLETKIVSIDPSPRSDIDQLVDTKIRQSLVECSPDLFAAMQPNDILFLDASHLAFHGTDVTFLFLRILPILPVGVLVHLHDIYLPDEYPERCDPLFYNEQYILGAFLLGNTQWRTLVPVHDLFNCGMLPFDGASFWMVRCEDTPVLSPEPRKE